MTGLLRSPPIPTLPGEVVDGIIDHLHDDHAALRACALVCRSWLAASRYHLFHECPISVRKGYDVDRASRFFMGTPDVAYYIRNLAITHHVVLIKNLDMLFAALPHLSSLSLAKLEIRVLQNEGCDPKATARFPALEELKIHSCNLNYDFRSLFRFLGLFTHLDRLELSIDIRILNLEDVEDLVPPMHLSLAHLSVFHIPLSVVRCLVYNTRTRGTLRALWYDDTTFDWPDAGELGGILGLLGPYKSLRRLVFGPLNIFTPYWDNFPPDADAENIGHWPALQLQSCSVLEEVSLRTGMLLRLHADFFAHLPPSVRTVKITFIGVDNVAEPGADSQWAEFDRAFSGSEFQRFMLVLDMARVKETTSRERYEAMKARAVEGLPTIARQGRLVVCEDSRAWWKGA